MIYLSIFRQFVSICRSIHRSLNNWAWIFQQRDQKRFEKRRHNDYACLRVSMCEFNWFFDSQWHRRRFFDYWFNCRRCQKNRRRVDDYDFQMRLHFVRQKRSLIQKLLNFNAREAITNSMSMWKTWDNNKLQLYQRAI